MTALCGGGTSGPKTGVAAVVDYSSGLIAAILASKGLNWLIPVIPLAGLPPLVLSVFCGADPPALPTFTSAETNALLQLQFGPDFDSGLSKLSDLILHTIWYDACQCNSGSLTAYPVVTPPAGTPIFQPPNSQLPTISFQTFYPMLRSDARILTLGCGSPVTPTGWFLPGFDDSGGLWHTPVAPATFPLTWAANAGGFQLGAGIGVNAALPGGIEVHAPASPLAHNCEQFLVRWRVFLGDITPHLAAIRVGSAVLADGGWTTGGAWANGHAIVAPTNAVGWQTFADALLPNQWNVIAFHVNSSNTASANTWGAEGGIFFGLDFTSVQSNNHVTPCCPPDVSTQASLDLILKMVTLIQRQSVPFAYLPSTTHPTLSGAGSFDISGLIGASIQVTTLPTAIGREGTSPTEYFDMGFVTFGTPDGYPTSYRLERDSQVMFPARCGLYTTLAYDLHPGVVITITELVREP